MAGEAHPRSRAWRAAVSREMTRSPSMRTGQPSPLSCSMGKDSTSVASALPRQCAFSCAMCASLHSTMDSSEGPATQPWGAPQQACMASQNLMYRLVERCQVI